MSLSNDIRTQLEATAARLVAPHKGILAADESFPSIEKRFQSIGLESTEENRQAYREMLLTAPGVSEFISGVILFDETLRQSTLSGKKFVDVLRENDVLPGIKVDQGTQALTDSAGEKMTLGLDGLAERLAEYCALGATFTKWRSVITIGEGLPTHQCIEANVKSLAEYALKSQEAGLVPIVEPETLMDGNHSWTTCRDVTAHVLRALFFALDEAGVHLPGLILKINMVVPGKESGETLSALQIGQVTVDVLKVNVPAEVAGIVFLSGGQSEDQATANLEAINQHSAPWPMSFSYGRALQDSALKTWAGNQNNVPVAQEALLKRAKLNSLARDGQGVAT